MSPLYSLHGVEVAYEKHVTLYEDYKNDRQVDQFQMYPNVTLGQAFIDAPAMAEWYIQVRGFTYHVKKREVRSQESLWGTYSVVCPQMGPSFLNQVLASFTGKDFYLQTVKNGNTEVLDQGNIVFNDSRPMYIGRDLPRQLQFYVMNSDTNLRRLLYQKESWMRLDLGIFRVDRESSGSSGSGLVIPASQIGRRRSHAVDIFTDQGGAPVTLEVPVQVAGGVNGGGLLTPPPSHLGRKFSLQ